MRINKQSFGRGVMMTVMMMGLVSAANAQTKPWTAAGSTGTVDESDANEVRFILGEAQMVPTAAVGTTSIVRYNVTAVDDTATLGSARMTVRYRTGDGTGRVLIRLYRYNFNPGGSASAILTFDSSAHPATQSGYVTRVVGDCSTPGLDFANNAYFIEVEFRKNGANGTPSLGTLKVDRRFCPAP